ncbi:putative lipoprotein [Bacteroides heparinolyticus]|uniref:Putative lipoprotein n=1 Tax=Prevotella heparinolytica TaxID=28113 RepID=A0A449I6U4_9BACE|nr:fimbrillin family protein [Bacteroides heparinolyticus]VFB15136.1 putative lipoprotein [Bacteroides heparinolyticus]
MKTIKNLAMLAVAALTAASCSHDENLVAPADHFPADGIIRVAADVTHPQTRAGMETTNLQAFRLRVENPVNATYSYNALMKKESGEWVSYDNAGADKLMMLWQNKTQKVNVAAVCIPSDITLTDEHWKTDGATPVNIKVEADQSNADRLNKSDLLAMKNHEVDPANDLTPQGKMKVELKHRLAKLNLTVQLGTQFNLNGAGTAANPITAVSVEGTKTEATWKLIEDAMTEQGSATPVKPLTGIYTPGQGETKSAVAKYECILVPQTIAANGFQVKIAIAGKTYTWKSPAEVNLASDTQYELTLTVGKDVVIVGGFSATPWTEGGTENIETE